MSQATAPRRRIVQVHAPTSDNSHYIPVVSAKPGITIRAVLLGGYTFACDTHWLDNRTFPHVEPAEICQGCLEKRRRRWKGYLGGWLPGKCRRCIVEITADAARNCPALFNGKQELRGRVLALSRIGRAVNAPVRAEFGPPPPKDGIKNLPDPFSVATALYRLWGLESEDVDAGSAPDQVGEWTAWPRGPTPGAGKEGGGSNG